MCVPMEEDKEEDYTDYIFIAPRKSSGEPKCATVKSHLDAIIGMDANDVQMNLIMNYRTARITVKDGVHLNLRISPSTKGYVPTRVNLIVRNGYVESYTKG